MNFEDPFYGYSFVLRLIVYGFVPVFVALQYVRLRRGLHVFQLEGYRRRRFLSWARANPRRALFLSTGTAKKPLVMTGRAWRILGMALVVTAAVVLVLPGIAHVALGGWPADIASWATLTGAMYFGAPVVLVASDLLLTPVQRAINARYVKEASRRLRSVTPVVVGVTGSFGKTSTKFAVEKLLAPPGAVLATPSSYNTPLGVCRTINENLRQTHAFFVVEMGAYGLGEIAELCRFVRPTIGVLTAIGPAHLERFGSLDSTRRAKYELIESLPGDGIAVMNVDDPEVRALADRTGHVGVVRYGLDENAAPDVTATDIEMNGRGTSFRVGVRNGGSIRVRTRLLGRHAVGHVLAGVAVATAVGRPLEELTRPIERLEPVEHRLQLVDGTGGVTVIDDAYNANPDGAAAALDVLAAMPGNKKVVVTPGMIELGPLQTDANERLGEHAGRVADAVIVVASVNRDALVAGATRGGRAEVIAVDSLEEAQGHLRRLLSAGDVVLFENDLPDQYES